MKKWSLPVKLIILAAVIYGVIMSMDDPNTFTKFTTLSNIGIGISMLLFVAVEVTGTKKKQWMFIFKFMMMIGVIITFVMYITLIAPKSEAGLIGSYANHHYGSLMMHMVSPVLSAADFYLFDDEYIPEIKHAMFSILPAVAYVAMIVIMAANGHRWAHGMSAPYAFLNFGAETGWWGFDLSSASKVSLGIGVGYMTLFLITVFVVIGIVMLGIKRKQCTK